MSDFTLLRPELTQEDKDWLVIVGLVEKLYYAKFLLENGTRSERRSYARHLAGLIEILPDEMKEAMKNGH